ncbi:unnamed protein product [Rhizophagus irregularis]|nr:unnamed protein product [Rhizophagus irregularis]CAB5345067.1 unnamed protein product [Rhizophagus irregularis]
MSKSLTLKGILKVEIKVRKDGLDSGLVLLKLGENLSNIRQELEKDSLINDTLLFAKGTSEIQRRSEREFLLNEIIEEIGDDKFINLKKNSNLGYDLKVLKDELQLEYGRKINSDGNIEIAENNAFILDVMDFKVYKEKGIGMEKKEVSSSGYNKSITELTLNGDINAYGFAKFGLSCGKSKNTMVGSEKKSICHYTYVNKISLKFKSFKPTVQFKDEIENAIKIKDHREKLKKFKDITEKFGQFISNEVLIGGRAYFLGEEKSGKFSEEKNKNGSITVEAMSSNAGIANTSGKLTETVNYSKNECFKLIGGKSDNPNNFDESAWIKSLDDFKNWDCIEYKNPVSIFQLLSYDLREKIFKSIGKRILYNGPEEEYTYDPTLKVNSKSLDIKDIKDNIQDDTECNIFATVIDVNNSKNEFFNCQVLWKEKENPKLIIHRVRKISKLMILSPSTNLECKQYNLKIRLMVVGYDVNFKFINSDFDDQIKVIKNEINTSSLECKKPFDDLYTEESICLGIPVLKKLDPHIVIGHHFYKDQENNRIGTYTFSYNWEKNCCVKLPEFTFYALIIPDYHHSGILNFSDKSIKLRSSEPKYISLHSKGDDCVPIFLRQRQGEIKIKCVKNKKKLKINDLMLHFFDNFQDLSKN